MTKLTVEGTVWNVIMTNPGTKNERLVATCPSLKLVMEGTDWADLRAAIHDSLQLYYEDDGR